MKVSRESVVLIFWMISSLAVYSQGGKRFSKEVEREIHSVENHLTGWVQIAQDSTHRSLADRMKFYHVNGVSIAVIKDYKLEWAKGYGWADSAEQIPVTPSTLFQAGSISKSLNAVGVLKLVQDGKLDLLTDINQYLKSWKFPYDSLSRGKKITLANLLSHTAGLTIHGFPGYALGDTIPTLVQILDGRRPANTQAVRSMYAPSVKYEYSGGGTTISQLILQDVSGQPYDVYMWENVLKPLGMEQSTYSQPPPENKRSLLATGYYNDGKPVKGKYHIYPEQAAAGLWTNPTDLSNYVIETQLALAGRSQKVLSQKMTEKRLTPYIDSSAALGVFVLNKNGTKYFTHDGVDEGFVSEYVGSFEGGYGAVVMTNTYNTTLFNEIINSVAQTYHWKDFYTLVVKREVLIPAQRLQTYVGRYRFRGDTLSIALKMGALYLDVGSDALWKIHFTDDTHWFVVEAKAEMNFAMDGSKKVTGFSLNDQSAIKIE